MEDVRKADPTFTGFVPRTAVEAVDRYVRCRKNGLKPMLVPECLIECAKGLQSKQLDLFEDWIINPNGSLDLMDIVPCDSISKSNESIYIENCKRNNYFLPDPTTHHPAKWSEGPDPTKLPPVPFVDDEKTMQETMQEQPDSTSSGDRCSTPST